MSVVSAEVVSGDHVSGMVLSRARSSLRDSASFHTDTREPRLGTRVECDKVVRGAVQQCKTGVLQ